MAALVCCCAAAHTYNGTLQYRICTAASQPAAPVVSVSIRTCRSLSPLDMGQAGQYHTTELNWLLLSRTVFYTCTIRARFTILVGLRAAPPFLHFAQVLYYPAHRPSVWNKVEE
jgi:hypothetical protein